MTATIDGIATWEESTQLPKDRFVEHAGSGITTEVELEENPAWEKIFNALLDMYVSTQSGANQDDNRPNRTSLGAALNWIWSLRKRSPTVPPTCVIPEPGGGIIIEWRARFRNGRDHLYELTFYNNGSAESTVYLDGRIISMNPIPLTPSILVG